ncbi:DEKNAAC103307 [Brettanomyces naardenensis]|uniref:DEKNAAC103307 n=1 Tax=Brettanomyces naardenensis TaxID=13370 RepID=A0A448YN10_BRENA|nr:DEKNAAC103307 [Brettanomyces naardenensis]
MSNLLSKFDNNVELLLAKFQEICTLSTVENKDYEVQSVESLQIESDGWTIIRIAEELLSVTRTLKESWILGQAKNTDPDKDPNDFSDAQLYDLYEKVNRLLDELASDA